MAQPSLRRIENVPGDFYVDNTCIDCDLCRQIAPDAFGRSGEQSAVYHQPDTPAGRLAALKALVTCPTASIGTIGRHPAQAAVDAFPEIIEDGVYFCGFASESSYGASSYLIVRDGGNVLVDSPRFVKPLARKIADLGGLRLIFLTHGDDVADHEAWSKYFGACRIMHRGDMGRTLAGIERVIQGWEPVAIGDDLVAIPTPGHTRGHTVLLYWDRFLFTGDHLQWSDALQSLYASRSVCWYSWSEQVRSAERLLDYSFEWVLPGHGRRTFAPAPEMRERLKTCVARMRTARGDFSEV